MPKIDKDSFLKSFKMVLNNSFNLFLGLGASANSGIPSDGDFELLTLSNGFQHQPGNL